jgi:hypothetical protein
MAPKLMWKLSAESIKSQLNCEALKGRQGCKS